MDQQTREYINGEIGKMYIPLFGMWIMIMIFAYCDSKERDLLEERIEGLETIHEIERELGKTETVN